MKEIKLTVKRQKTEWRIFGVCFLIALLMNVFSIVKFHTEWKELYTQIGWVLVLAVILYALALLIRMLYLAVYRRIFPKKHPEKEIGE